MATARSGINTLSRVWLLPWELRQLRSILQVDCFNCPFPHEKTWEGYFTKHSKSKKLLKLGKTTPGKTSNERVKMFYRPVTASTCLHMELNNITVLEHMVSLHHLAIVNILSPYLSILQLFQEILVDFRGKIL